MYFGYPLLLLLLLLVFLPFLFPRVRRALLIPSLLVTKEGKATKFLRLLFDAGSVLFWTASVFISILILAWPLEDVPNFIRTERVRKICLVADVSTSMSGLGIERSKKILHEFVDKRRGDWQCLVAYSGNYGQEGGAMVIQPLTPDITLMHQILQMKFQL